MTSREPVLQITSLTVKRTQAFTLSIPSLTLQPGQVACVAGANGSGKTTLIEATAGLITSPPGTVKIQGQTLRPSDPNSRLLIGYIPDDDNWIIPELTASEYFDLLGSIYSKAGLTQDTRTLARNLAKHLFFTSHHQQLGTLSHGNRKKVQIIAALLHQPALLIVDELRNGLDPIAIRQAEELLRSRAKTGTAILAATHDLWWAERFADNILMLLNGKVLLQEPTTKIVADAGNVEAKFLTLYGQQT